MNQKNLGDLKIWVLTFSKAVIEFLLLLLAGICARFDNNEIINDSAVVGPSLNELMSIILSTFTPNRVTVLGGDVFASCTGAPADE